MKKLLFLLLSLLPLVGWGTPVVPDEKPKYHLDVNFNTNGNAGKGPFSWKKGDVMSVTTLKNDDASSPEAVMKSVYYYIDGEFLGSISKHFKFTNTLDDITIGRHDLLTKVYWNAGGAEFHSDFKWDLYIVTAAGTQSVYSQGDNEMRQAIQLFIDGVNESLPTSAQPGITLVKQYVDGDFVVVLNQVDENTFSISQIDKVKEVGKAGIIESYNTDPTLKDFTKMLVKCKMGIVIKYVGNQSGKTSSLIITSDELAGN